MVREIIAIIQLSVIIQKYFFYTNSGANYAKHADLFYVAVFSFFACFVLRF
jgi:hypothetical protein